MAKKNSDAASQDTSNATTNTFNKGMVKDYDSNTIHSWTSGKQQIFS